MRATRVRVAIAVTATVLALAACSSSSNGTPKPTATPTTTPTAVNPTAPCNDGAAGNASIEPARSSTDPAAWKSDKLITQVAASKTLTVGVSGDALLWGYSDAKGNLAGYDVDVAEAVASELHVTPEFRVLPLSARIAALNTPANDGGVDMVVERFSINCDRWQGTGSAGTDINFSSAYYTANQGLLVRQDLVKQGINSLATLKGYPVCGVDGSTSLMYLRSVQKANGFTIVTAADSGQCLVEFQQGQAAAISADETTLAGFADQDKFAIIVTTSLPHAPQQSYGIGLPPKDNDFTQYVNAVLAKLRSDGKLDQLWRKKIKPVTGGRFSPIPGPTYGRDPSKLERS